MIDPDISVDVLNKSICISLDCGTNNYYYDIEQVEWFWQELMTKCHEFRMREKDGEVS